MKSKFHVFLLLLILSAFPLHAQNSSINNHLDSLMNAMKQFTAESPVSGILTVEVVVSTDDDDEQQTRSDAAVVRIAADTDGVSIHVPQEQIKKIRQSAESDASESDSSPSAALEEINGILVNELLNAAETLKHSLKYAEFETERQAPENSTYAREWVFRLNPPMSDRERRRFRELDLTVTVLTDSDGIPVEARVRRRIRGRVMLVSFEMNSDEHLQFKVVDDRLITTYHKKSESGSGMGQSSESTKLYRLNIDKTADIE